MNVLFVAGDCPYPPDNGCRLRIFNLLRHLSQRHEITLIASSEPCKDLGAALDHKLKHVILVPPMHRTISRSISSLISSLPYSVRMYENSAMFAAVTNALTADHFDLLHCDLMSVVSAIPMDAQLPKVYGSHNVEAMIWERYARQERRPWMIPLLRSQLKKVVEYESQLPQLFDRCVTVSEMDREEMRLRYGFKNISVVTNGVDLDFYTPLPDPLAPTLAFIGSLDWRPNQDAVRWLVESIWPRIRIEMPQASLSLVGRRPPRWIANCCKHANISLRTDVPDVRPCLASTSLIVVPLRIGGGSRLKILEAMAAGRCVVSTTIGAEGLGVHDGEDIVIADDSTGFARQIVALLKNPARRQALASAGRALVEAKYGWDTAALQMDDAWSQACMK